MSIAEQNAALMRKTAHVLDLLAKDLRVQADQLAKESRGDPLQLRVDATEASRVARTIRRLANCHELPWPVSSWPESP